LIYVVFTNLERSPDITRLNYASILMLNYFQKNDDGEDEVLSDATDKLLQSLEGESIKEYIIEENSNAVVGDESGRAFGEILETPSMIAMLVWLAVTYF
jgi:hypothetical protein